MIGIMIGMMTGITIDTSLVSTIGAGMGGMRGARRTIDDVVLGTAMAALAGTTMIGGFLPLLTAATVTIMTIPGADCHRPALGGGLAPDLLIPGSALQIYSEQMGIRCFHKSLTKFYGKTPFYQSK